MKRVDLPLCAGAKADYRRRSEGRTLWCRRGSCVFQYSDDPRGRVERGSGVVLHSQRQKEQKRFARAAGIAAIQKAWNINTGVLVIGCFSLF